MIEVIIELGFLDSVLLFKSEPISAGLDKFRRCLLQTHDDFDSPGHDVE